MSSDTIDLPQIDDYRSLFLNDTPMMDVRAPVEFEQGAFPHTENLPLMNDEERRDVGIRYKENGQDAAIELGHELVQGKVKEARVDRWAEFFQQHPEGILYCFRGGMRSKISQQWIYERTGIVYPRVKGGYKAMRRFLIDEMEASIERLQPVILGGQTGVGKTRFLQKIANTIDLEGIYHHRGSVFGNHVTPQPTQIDIENNLSIAMLKYLHHGHHQVLLEDESANIGRRHLPRSLYEKMQQSPLVMLQADLEERIAISFQEYIDDDLAEFQAFYGEEQGFRLWAQRLEENIDKIKKRLGGVRHKTLKDLLAAAVEQHRSGNSEVHREWIRVLLEEYYDPMYAHQLEKKRERIVFRGTVEEVTEYLGETYQIR
jgi:tRNA 2-selenouridine synthase